MHNQDVLKQLLMSPGARLSTGDMWLCYDEDTDKWCVYQHKFAAKKVLVLHEGDLEGAVKILVEDAQ